MIAPLNGELRNKARTETNIAQINGNSQICWVLDSLLKSSACNFGNLACELAMLQREKNEILVWLPRVLLIINSFCCLWPSKWNHSHFVEAKETETMMNSKNKIYIAYRNKWKSFFCVFKCMELFHILYTVALHQCFKFACCVCRTITIANYICTEWIFLFSRYHFVHTHTVQCLYFWLKKIKGAGSK